MAKIPSTIEVTCPCCSALLKVDTATAEVIAHTAAVKPRMFSDMEEAARAMKEQDSRRESIFRQSVEAQKHAAELLDKKFQEAVKKAKESPEKSIAENTPAAFDFALASGCDGVEFDVRLSADGEAVICHNPLSHGLDIGRSPARKLRLPLLKDVLARYEHTAFLDIELKVPGLEAVTTKLLETFRPAHGFVVSSFLPEALGRIKQLDATIPLGLLCETSAELQRWPQMPVEYVIVHHKLLGLGLIRQITDKNKKVFVWTVNAPAQMRRFAAWGVDGIISDYPDRITKVLQSESNAGA
jgi:glycerophosphoryl diester phosphodiesterase